MIRKLLLLLQNDGLAQGAEMELFQNGGNAEIKHIMYYISIPFCVTTTSQQ
jgi:hypothetical protein